MLLAVHGHHLRERYETIVRGLDGAETVFEPLCGPALLPKFLPKEVGYSGFDINDTFVRYARRKGYRVSHGDATQDEAYQGVNVDGAVLIDALHHIHPYEEQQKIVERTAKTARKRLVISDPFADCYLAISERFPSLLGISQKIFNWMESDGPNQSRYDNRACRDALEARMKDGYGVLKGVSHDMQQVGPMDLIVTYHL